MPAASSLSFSRAGALRGAAPRRASSSRARPASSSFSVSASAIKLHYFNGRGRAEVARMILKDAGVDFEDLRFEPNPAGEPMFPMYSFQEWVKTGISPTGQAPLLEIDGLCLVQSQAIAQYLGRKLGYYGEDDAEAAKIDMVGESVRDLGTFYGQAIFSKDEEKVADFWDSKFPRWMGILEGFLGEGSDWFVGSKPSIADISCYGLVEALQLSPTEGVKEKFNALKGDYPKVMALCERVEARPGIAQWLKERPHSVM